MAEKDNLTHQEKADGLSFLYKTIYHIYPYAFFMAATVAFVRFVLFLLHVYNPTLSWMPSYGRLTELLVCLGFAVPAIALWAGKKWFIRTQGVEEAFAAYHEECEHPPTRNDDRWGGSSNNWKIVLVGSLLFLVATFGFSLLGLIRNWSRG